MPATSSGRRLATLCVLALAACATTGPVVEVNQLLGPCAFDVSALAFSGDAPTQARCLLRPVAPGGRLAPEPADLPSSLAVLIGQPVGDLRPQLQRYMVLRGIGDAEVGGPLDAPLSRARDDDPAAPPARYFVIHDTSTPWLGDAAFPPDDDAALNDLRRFAGPDAVAHVFVNRRGQTLLGHDFRVPWRATRLESRAIGVASRGLFLHVELAQPRRRDPAGGARNDLLAPVPGFTDAQYARLALLYAAASARRGDWLVPAFHAAIDEGLPDAHDDPQHFEIGRFAEALATLLDALAR
jgi:hypothetical protein